MTDPEKQTTHQGRFTQLLRQLEDVRKLLLAVAGLSYPLGWAIWSFNAHKNDLGPLPAVQYQYLVAGLVPLLILVIAIFAGKHLRHFMLQTWPRLLDSRTMGILALRITIFVLFFGLPS
jgi:hypothetical protein